MNNNLILNEDSIHFSNINNDFSSNITSDKHNQINKVNKNLFFNEKIQNHDLEDKHIKNFFEKTIISLLSFKVEKNNKRNLGIDFARILSMFFIINHHIIYHGGPLFKTNILSIENNLLLLFNTIFCSGVNIFGMISGYVGFHSHKFSNLIYLLLQTFFYNYGIAFYFKKTKPNTVKDLNHFLYPLFISDYWYFNAYFILYFFLPLFNSGIKSMGKKEMTFFIISNFLLFSCFNQIKHYSRRLKKDFFFFFEWIYIYVVDYLIFLWKLFWKI